MTIGDANLRIRVDKKRIVSEIIKRAIEIALDSTTPMKIRNQSAKFAIEELRLAVSEINEIAP